MTFENTDILTPAQCRAARALLEVGQTELAELAGVAASTVSILEGGRQAASLQSLKKIRRALEQAGTEFLEGDGVRRREEKIVQIIKGEDANLRVHDDIYHTLKKRGGEVLCAGVTELDESAGERFALLKRHIERLRDVGITERILLREGDTNLVAPREWYRWIKADYFGRSPFQIYGDKIALKDLANNQILIIRHPLFAQSQTAAFNALWDIARPVDTGALGDD